MVTTAIHNRALLVSLSLSTWSARKYDRKVTDKINTEYAAARDAGRYNKYLLPGDAPSYKALLQLAGSIRTAHYAQTLAWSDEGWRLLPTAQYMDYTTWVRQQTAEFHRVLDSFIDDYPSLRDVARTTLNGMYRDEDYPTIAVLRQKFAIALEYSPVPATGDIRVDLGSEQIATIEQSIHSRVQAATQIAVQDAWNRLRDVVSHVADRLANPDAIFRNSLISNVREVCDVLSRLNVTNDPQLEQFRSDVDKQIASLDPDHLREDSAHRANVARQAESILSAMSQVYGSAAA